MINQNFIIAGIIASIVSTLLLKIFASEISQFVDDIKGNKPINKLDTGGFK